MCGRARMFQSEGTDKERSPGLPGKGTGRDWHDGAASRWRAWGMEVGAFARAEVVGFVAVAGCRAGGRSGLAGIRWMERA